MTLIVSTAQATTPDPSFWSQPIAPALVAAAGALLIFFFTQVATYILKKREAADARKLANQRFEFDQELAQRKLAADLRLAGEQFRLEQAGRVAELRRSFAQSNLRLFYEAKARLTELRSAGLILQNENETREGREQETQAERAVRDEVWPRMHRLREQLTFFNDLYSHRYEARVLFGGAAEQPYMAIWEVLSLYLTALQALYRTPEIPQQLDFRERMRQQIYEGLAEEDPIPGQIDRAVQAAEESFSIAWEFGQPANQQPA